MLPVAPSQWKAVVGRFRRLVSCLHPTLANKITQMVYDAAVDGVTTEEALALVVQHSGPDEIVVCCADCIDVLRVHAFELLSATQPARGRGMGTEGGAEGALTSTDSKWLQEYLRDLTLLRGLVRDIAAAPPSLGNHMMATLICLAWDAPDNCRVQWGKSRVKTCSCLVLKPSPLGARQRWGVKQMTVFLIPPTIDLSVAAPLPPLTKFPTPSMRVGTIPHTHKNNNHNPAAPEIQLTNVTVTHTEPRAQWVHAPP
jgi:hypothetical protein